MNQYKHPSELLSALDKDLALLGTDSKQSPNAIMPWFVANEPSHLNSGRYLQAVSVKHKHSESTAIIGSATLNLMLNKVMVDFSLEPVHYSLEDIKAHYQEQAYTTARKE